MVASISAQDRLADTAIAQMPQTLKLRAYQLYSALDKSCSPQERSGIEQELTHLNPVLKQVLDRRDQIMGDENIKNLTNYMNIESDLEAEKNQAAITRFTYGRALAKVGDVAEAKGMVADALKLNNNHDPEFVDFWHRTAVELCVPIDATKFDTTASVPPDAVAKSVTTVVRAEPANYTNPTAPLQTETCADGSSKNSERTVHKNETAHSAISAENQGLRPDQIIAAAELSLKKNGMTNATEKQFEDAIASADALYSPQVHEQIQQWLQGLASGKKVDGTAITPQERAQLHEMINHGFAAATLPVQFRLAYGQLLNANKQYAAAEKIFQENIQAADKQPLQQFHEELNQLTKDVQDQSISRADQADFFRSHAIYSRRRLIKRLRLLVFADFDTKTSCPLLRWRRRRRFG